VRATVEAIDPALFTDAEVFRALLTNGRPFVVRGLCADWPAVQAAQASDEALSAYLQGFASDRKAELFIGEAAIKGRYFYGETLDKVNFERIEMPLSEGLTRILASAAVPDVETVYMGSLRADRFAPGFQAENNLSALPSEIVARLWLGNASRVTCHYDTYDNLACLVAGRRHFTLFPPKCIGDLYIGPIDRTLSGAPVSLAAGSTVGDPRYPRFAQAREQALTADLMPGDALYVPKLWWHQVDATAPFNMLVNYWWDAFSAGSDAPATAMLLAMIAIAERPEAERAAWRAFFEHYVFRADGHPLAHLPQEEHGILGPLRKGNYGRIRAMIMQQLRGL